ncbi:MAG: cytochrome P460 family protein [Terriglobales bacterium]
MIAAYKAGIPGNGKPFPDGSKIAKLQWKPKKSTEAAPFVVDVPDVFTQVFMIEKDSNRFPKSGWMGIRGVQLRSRIGQVHGRSQQRLRLRTSAYPRQPFYPPEATNELVQLFRVC